MISSQGNSDLRALRLSRERQAQTFSGYAMLLVLLLFAAAAIGGFALIASRIPLPGAALFVLGVLGALFVAAGFYFLQPNQAAAILLFGDYRGTDRKAGLRWRWPWLTRTKISTRVHNVTSERLKVNDLRGNPIEIASNVVWRVTDTAQALYDVDDYTKFVFVQIESAVRAIGARYPYDDIEHQETTLRGHADVVSEELKTELQDRVSVAGITIDECRLTHLAYAAEIAQAMLRRQQAEAVIAARQKLVTGAVTMVESALQMLSEKEVVELDDERRAAMVSNLMVVLCSERDTQPVVNTGTLYQ
ncbi:SPFH domain-containing protein [Sphingomonas parva]|uniref:SPFH domain-containing protein n=2 Tax=Sphingomonas parva TaxID=2555898 RepID=A0A4Y8ZZB9_9SPHN|nr:SPFH domain-containing protein [Sphingomonas parva]TFI60126.1 SPFH domain-containing protein [Sphingomonas parva]